MAEIPSGYFPDYDIGWDIRYSRKYKTIIRESKVGKEQRRRMFPVRSGGQKGGYGTLTCSSAAYTPTQRQVVADFLDSKDGAFKAFYLFRRDLDNFTDYYVGDVLDQSNIIIPFKDVTATSVKVDDESKTFNVTSNIGSGGESRVNFLEGPQSGQVTVTLRARERWIVRALNDEVIEAFIANVVNDNVIFSLAFKQLR